VRNEEEGKMKKYEFEKAERIRKDSSRQKSYTFYFTLLYL
jgi:hypothetical protein